MGFNEIQWITQCSATQHAHSIRTASEASDVKKERKERKKRKEKKRLILIPGAEGKKACSERGCVGACKSHVMSWMRRDYIFDARH